MLQQRPVCQHTRDFLVLFSLVFSTLSLTNHFNRQTFALMHDCSTSSYNCIVIITFEENAATDIKLQPVLFVLNCGFLDGAYGIIMHLVFLWVCVYAFSEALEYKAAVIQGSWHRFFVVSPYMMDASPTYRKALKTPVILTIFLCHYNCARMQSSYITPAHVRAIS